MTTRCVPKLRLNLVGTVLLSFGALLCLTENTMADYYNFNGTSACSITNSGISFGAYDVSTGAAVTNSGGSIGISCDTTLVAGTGTSAVATIKLNVGTSTSGGGTTLGSFSQRRMRTGTSGNYVYMNYNIYTEPSYTTIWGDGTSSTSYLSFTAISDGGNRATASYTLYGKIDAGQYSLRAGPYAAYVVATITW